MLQFLLSNPSSLRGCFSEDLPPSKSESIENFYTNRKSCVFLHFFFAKWKKWCVLVSRCSPNSRSHLCYLVILCWLSETSFFFSSLLFSSLKTRKEMQQHFSVSFVSAHKQNGVFSFSADLCEHLLKMAALKTTKWVFCHSVASKFRSRFLRCPRSLSSAASQFYQPSVSKKHVGSNPFCF